MSTKILTGHAIDVLRDMPAGSASMCITSPSYYSLRRYKGPEPTWPDGWTGQLGLEPRVEDYIDHLVAVMREVRRVLHPTGCLFINLGDSYSSDPKKGGSGTPTGRNGRGEDYDRRGRDAPALPAGNLLGIPWRVALAMQADGWILRSAITCVKVAPMPESIQGVAWRRCRVKVADGKSPARNLKPEERRGLGLPAGCFPDTAEYTDCPGCAKCEPNQGYVLRWGSGRPTSATEQLFVFAAGPRYFWDSEAIRVEAKYGYSPSPGMYDRLIGCNQHRDNRVRPARIGGEWGSVEKGDGTGGRNAWNYQRFEDASDVWEWRPEPFGGEHYACFPTSLPAWCIKAGSSDRGVCPHCGGPWARVVESERFDRTQDRLYGGTLGHNPSGTVRNGNTRGCPDPQTRTLAWRPTCTCPPHEPVPATILDCFGGAGTTAIAADRLGRDCVLVEASEEYAEMARRRIEGDAGLFSEIEMSPLE